MELDQIISKVSTIFQNVFDDEKIIITNKTNSDEIDEWDSLNHILLVIEIEKTFSIKFLSGEISSFKNVGEMCENIMTKLK